jgi:hypothetical protein
VEWHSLLWCRIGISFIHDLEIGLTQEQLETLIAWLEGQHLEDEPQPHEE